MKESKGRVWTPHKRKAKKWDRRVYGSRVLRFKMSRDMNPGRGPNTIRKLEEE